MRWDKLWKKSEFSWHYATSVAGSAQIAPSKIFPFSQTSTRYTILKRTTSLCLYFCATSLRLLTRCIQSHISSALHRRWPLHIYHESSGTRESFMRGWSEIHDVPAAPRLEIPTWPHDITSWYAFHLVWRRAIFWLIRHNFGRLEGKLSTLTPGSACLRLI
jgi:hypothetical protein